MMVAAQNWKEGETVTIKIKRAGKDQVLSGKLNLSYEESEGYHIVDTSKEVLKNAWLKG